MDGFGYDQLVAGGAYFEATSVLRHELVADGEHRRALEARREWSAATLTVASIARKYGVTLDAGSCVCTIRSCSVVVVVEPLSCVAGREHTDVPMVAQVLSTGGAVSVPATAEKG